MGKTRSKEEKMNTVVSDTGPIIHLSEINQLSLLKNCGKVYIPERVKFEADQIISIKWPAWFIIEKLSDDESKRVDFWVRTGCLHGGESEAFELFKKLKADWYLTDDAEARSFVSEFGHEVHGTLGVILWNLVDNHINKKQALNSISELRKSSIWLSEKIISHAITAVKEISDSKQ
jgi:predicted nucleic acid-binding protein